MKRVLTLFILLLVPFFKGCPKADESARDGIAAATGVIQAAQNEYKAQCTALPSAPTCMLINEAVRAQNLSITALEVYCGFTVNVSLPTATCTPVKTAQAALTSTISNLGQLTGEITALLQGAKKTTALRNARNREASILASTPRVPNYRQIENIRLGAM